MKRFAHTQQIGLVLVLILATTVWLPCAQRAGSPPITPLLAAATLSIASVASAEPGAPEQAPSRPRVLLIEDSICGAGIWSMSITAGVAGEGDTVLSVPQVRALAGTKHRAVYPHNPVLRPGTPGAWDSGALGSMTVLKVGDLFQKGCDIRLAVFRGKLQNLVTNK
jgi:hypothetical protein